MLDEKKTVATGRSVKKICLFLAVILIICLAVNQIIGKQEQCTEHVVSSATVGEIVAGRTVSQTVQVDAAELYGFSLRFATYGKTITSHVRVVLQDDTDSVLFDQTMNASVLQDNQFYSFRFSEPLTGVRGTLLRISVSSPDAVNGNALTIWSSNENSYLNGTLSLNGIEAETSDISFQLFHSMAASPAAAGIVAATLLFFAVVLALWLRSRAKRADIEPKRSSWVDFGVCVASAMLLAFALSCIYTAFFCKINSPVLLTTVGATFKLLFSPANLLRTAVLFPFAILITAMLQWNAKQVLHVAFAKRWLIAGGIFAWYVLFSINFSNVGAFHNIIQPDMGNDRMSPLFGMVRSIRSDEWLVNLPLAASSDFGGYGEFGEILRGTVNYNLPSTGLYLSYSALNDPLSFGYFLFGAERGASFFWCATMILSVMLSLEFSYIISKKNKLVALLGVGLIAMSPFNLWWSVSTLLTGFMGILVCAYYCFQAEKFSARVLCMLGVAMSGAFFICQLYPAWQVPMVYLLLPLFVWVLIENRKALGSFRAREWVAAGCAVAFMASIVLAYLLDTRDYTASIMGTVYPGERFETGGYALDKAYAFVQTLQFPFEDVKVGSNNSEASTFFSLFPLPMLIGGYVLIRQVIAKISDKSESIDLLNLLLLIPTAFLTVYCTVGIPDWLARITLMSYSPAARAVDWLAFANLLLLLRHASGLNKYRLSAPIAAALVGMSVVNSLIRAQRMCPDYLNETYVLLATALAFAFGLACFAKLKPRVRKATFATVAAIFILIGVAVSPVNSGIGALTEKPAAQKIQEISQAEPEAKWIGYGNIIVGQYAVANGAPCITSTNYTPNMELWQKLDPEGKYNEVYNRYSHITLEFTEGETEFVLLTADHMNLKLSYGDIEKTGCKYIFALSPISENSSIVDFKLVYNESNAFIYEIIQLP